MIREIHVQFSLCFCWNQYSLRSPHEKSRFLLLKPSSLSIDLFCQETQHLPERNNCFVRASFRTIVFTMIEKKRILRILMKRRKERKRNSSHESAKKTSEKKRRERVQNGNYWYPIQRQTDVDVQCSSIERRKQKRGREEKSDIHVRTKKRERFVDVGCCSTTHLVSS